MKDPGRIKLNRTTDEVEGDIDIIAIHGIDTDKDSRSTWSWNPDSSGSAVDWLSDQSMLPSCIGKANIWTCDWHIDLLLLQELEPRDLEDIARDLLATLEHYLIRHTDAAGATPRPIVFIASCFGGVLLMKTLTLWSRTHSVLLDINSVSGVIFLGTPFKSTSLKRVVQWAKPILGSWAKSEKRELRPLLKLFDLTVNEIDKIVQEFRLLITTRWHHRALECQLFTIYDPLLGGVKSSEKQERVSLNSGSNSQIMEKPHALMSKFPNSEDGSYDLVRLKVEEFLNHIRTQSHIISKADQEILSCYKSKIPNQRLSCASGSWSIERCSINLGKAERLDESDPDALYRQRIPSEEHLTTGNSTTRNLVELQQLFEDREDEVGNVFQPRRILICGRPGIGKTTLCKKIMHEHTENQLWKPHFDRLLWIPLRNLTLHGECCDVFDLFRKELFSQCPEKEDYVDALAKHCEGNRFQRTLFILDGLDEVWYGLPYDNVKRGLALELLNMPNVIVTSRPSAALLLEAEPFHLRLEILGLDPEQKDSFIEAVGCNDIDALKRCLALSPVLQDLCRVPIHLDAVCAGGTEMHDQSIQTATGLYKAVLQHVESTHPEESLPFLRQTLSFLEEKALQRIAKSSALSEFEVPEVVFQSLCRIPFVRSSGGLPRGTSMTACYFIHLTFQEYFAARHIVHLWTNQPETARWYLHKYKYTARFAMVWRFVAGLLSGQGHIQEFFYEIGKVPVDMLGPAHETLLTQCLKELAEPLEFQGSIEKCFTGWLSDHSNVCLVELDELPVRYLLHLASMKPFPRHGFSQMTQHITFSERARRGALQALGHRLDLNESALQKVAALLNDNDEKVRMEAGHTLGNFGNLPVSVRNTIRKHLGGKDIGAITSAVHALKGTATLDDAIIGAIVEFLTTGGIPVRTLVLDAVRCWPDVPSPILKAIVDCLGIQGLIATRLRWSAIYAIKSMSKLPKSEPACQAVIGCLSDKISLVRWAAVYTLKATCVDNLPEPALLAIQEHLMSKKVEVKRAVIESLQRQVNLPDSVVGVIVESLDDDDVKFRRGAVEVLKNQASLSPSMIEKIAVSLEVDSLPSTAKRKEPSKKKTKKRRSTALYVIRDRRDLPTSVIEKVIQCLRNEDLDLRSLAVHALKGQSDQIIPLDAIVRCIKQDHANIATAATDVIRGRPGLCQRAVDGILLGLPDGGGLETTTSTLDVLDQLKHIPRLSNSMVDWIIATEQTMPGIRKAAVETLKGQPNLSESAIETLTSSWLGDDDKMVRCAVVEVLEGISNLSETAMSAIVKWARSKHLSVQRTALCALAGRPCLPPHVIDAMIDCLDDNDENLRQTALHILKGRENLPQSIHRHFFQWLGSENAEYRIVALDGLKGGPPLLPDTLGAIIKCLSHKNVRVRRAAADALQDQPEHLESAPGPISKWLGVDGDANLRRAAIYALEGQPNLPDAILDAIADCIGSKDSLLREAASKDLRCRASLPESTVLRITTWMKPSIHTLSREYIKRRREETVTGKDNVLEARRAALEILQDRLHLPEATLNSIAECLGDKDIDLRWSAVYALKGRLNLPDSTFALVTRCLRNRCVLDVRWAAMDVLKDTPNLPRLAVNMIANCLHYTDKYQKKAALEILMGQAELSPSAVSAILKCDEFDTRSVLRLMRHEVVRELLLKTRSQTFADALAQAESNEFDALSVLRLMRHEVVRGLLLNTSSQPFVDALAQAARDYHLSWTIDGGKSMVEMEEGNWAPAQSG